MKQEKAHEIMGENYFGVEETKKYLGMDPTGKELSDLADVPFSPEFLEERKDSHILVAFFPISIIEIRQRVRHHQLFSDASWYKDFSFAREKGKTAWHLVPKEPIPMKSAWEAWNGEKKCVRESRETPPPWVMVYAIIGYFLMTEKRLFEDVETSCKWPSLDNTYIYVGFFDDNGLVLGFYCDD